MLLCKGQSARTMPRHAIVRPGAPFDRGPGHVARPAAGSEGNRAELHRLLGRDDWPGDKLPGVEIGLGLLKLQAGSEGEGLRHLEAAVNRTRALGRPATLSGTMSFVAARLARARALLGDTDEATQCLNVAEASAPETDVDETERLRARAALAAQEGRAAIAFEHAAAAVARAERTDLPNLHGATLEDLASIAPDHERRDILRRALRAYEQKGNAVASARVRDTLSRSP